MPPSTAGLKEDGFVSPHLFAKVKVGDELVASGPAGSFYYEPLIDRGELVMLAGGSGVTPFMSIVSDFVRRGWPAKGGGCPPSWI